MAGALPLLLVAHSANAQLFDTFVPSQISGAGVEPDVTVTSRERTGYDNGGVRAGAFIIRPRLTQSLGYETNVFGSSTNPRGSALSETSASMEARTDGSYGSVAAAANVNNNRYLDLPNQSYTTWNARVGGDYRVGRDVATLFVSHENQVQTQRDLDVPNLQTPLPVSVDRIRAGYIATLNRLSLTPEVEVSRFAYESGASNGVIYDQGFRNRIVVTPGVTATYEFATRRRAVLVVRDTVAFYKRGSATEPRKNFNDALVLGGLDYDLDGRLRTRVLVGYERRTFSSNAYPTLQAPIAELTLIYNLTGLTTITGSLARRIQDSASETTAGVTSLTGQVRVDHELRRNVLLAATVGIIRNDYASNTGAQTLYLGSTSASYLINRYAAASASYDLIARTSGTNNLNLNGQNAGSDYVDHRLMLSLRLAL